MDDQAAAPARAPRRRRKEARPAELVQAGFQVFARHGFAATRLEDVARQAGVAKGTIYLYFDTKEALFEAVIRQTISPLLDRVEALGQVPGGRMEDLLRLLIGTVYRELVGTERRQIMRMLIAESGRFPHLASFYYRETLARGRSILERVVAQGVASGEFRAGPATRCPEVVLGPAIMAAVWKMVFEAEAPLDLDAFMEAHIDLALNGLKAERSAEA